MPSTAAGVTSRERPDQTKSPRIESDRRGEGECERNPRPPREREVDRGRKHRDRGGGGGSVATPPCVRDDAHGEDRAHHRQEAERVPVPERRRQAVLAERVVVRVEAVRKDARRERVRADQRHPDDDPSENRGAVAAPQHQRHGERDCDVHEHPLDLAERRGRADRPEGRERDPGGERDHQPCECDAEPSGRLDAIEDERERWSGRGTRARPSPTTARSTRPGSRSPPSRSPRPPPRRRTLVACLVMPVMPRPLLRAAAYSVIGHGTSRRHVPSRHRPRRPRLGRHRVPLEGPVHDGLHSVRAAAGSSRRSTSGSRAGSRSTPPVGRHAPASRSRRRATTSGARRGGSGSRATTVTPSRRLKIPRLGLSAVVVNGTSVADLRRGPGRHLDTFMPGERELVYIAGHRTTYGAPFGDINELRRGDHDHRSSSPTRSVVVPRHGHRIVDDNDVSVLESHAPRAARPAGVPSALLREPALPRLRATRPREATQLDSSHARRLGERATRRDRADLRRRSGTLLWRPVRRTLDIGAFGINAYIAPNAGDDVVEEHEESTLGHEEVYVVLSGRATFTLDGETLDAPGRHRRVHPRSDDRATCACRRAGNAGSRGRRTARRASYEPSPWEDFFAATRHRNAGDYDAYLAELEDGARAAPRPPGGRSTTSRRAKVLLGRPDEAIADIAPSARAQSRSPPVRRDATRTSRRCATRADWPS